MTEKNIFAYKLYLSLNISDFNLFFMWKLEKSHRLFPSNPPLTVEVLLSPPPPPFLKIWLEAQPSLHKRGRGGCRLIKPDQHFQIPVSARSCVFSWTNFFLLFYSSYAKPPTKGQATIFFFFIQLFKFKYCFERIMKY